MTDVKHSPRAGALRQSKQRPERVPHLALPSLPVAVTWCSFQPSLTAMPATPELKVRRDRKPKCFAVMRAKHCGGPSLPPTVSDAGARGSVATTPSNDGVCDVAGRFLQFA